LEKAPGARKKHRPGFERIRDPGQTIKMKAEKISVYSLTAVLFLLMIAVYWLVKIKTRPAYFLVIDIFLFLLLARAGGNVALVIFQDKMPASIVAGIMAMTMFPMLFIRSNVLFIFTLMLWAPITTFLISYSLFKKRSRIAIVNLAKVLAAGILACVFYLSVVIMIVENNPSMSSGGEYAGLFWLFLGIVIGCIEIIILIVILIKEYALQKNGAGL
jgi:hypothetical protein